jgi:nucleoporin GLE1
MCGIMALYAAIVQTKNAKITLYTIKHGWIWMSRILNMRPRRITSQLLLVFLQIAGNELLKVYKKQAEKLIHYIIEEIIPNLDKGSIASNTRLKLFLEETVLSKSTIPIYPNSQILE